MDKPKYSKEILTGAIGTLVGIPILEADPDYCDFCNKTTQKGFDHNKKVFACKTHLPKLLEKLK